MATWQTEGHRRRHFAEHGAEMGYATLETYDAGVELTRFGGEV
jgi:hypothetical protein